jgi:hypothetical protein
MPKLFRIELKLVNAKAGTYEITPYISKEPIANNLAKAQEIEPGRNGYGASIGLIVKRKDGSEYSPTNTVVIDDRDDNNPNTVDPYINQLPNTFTFSEFKKYNPSATKLQDSYQMNKDEELYISISTATQGKILATVKLPIKPVEISAIQNKGN